MGSAGKLAAGHLVPRVVPRTGEKRGTFTARFYIQEGRPITHQVSVTRPVLVPELLLLTRIVSGLATSIWT